MSTPRDGTKSATRPVLRSVVVSCSRGPSTFPWYRRVGGPIQSLVPESGWPHPIRPIQSTLQVHVRIISRVSSEMRSGGDRGDGKHQNEAAFGGMVQKRVTAQGGRGRRPQGEPPRSEASALGLAGCCQLDPSHTTASGNPPVWPPGPGRGGRRASLDNLQIIYAEHTYSIREHN
jgi:hypothetical protein